MHAGCSRQAEPRVCRNSAPDPFSASLMVTPPLLKHTATWGNLFKHLAKRKVYNQPFKRLAAQLAVNLADVNLPQ